MKNRILVYLKHLLGTIVLVLLIGIIVVISMNGSLEYGNNPVGINLEKEGPYVFYEADSTLKINYIRGNKTEGFYLDEEKYSRQEAITQHCYFPLDSSSFDFVIQPQITVPNSTYNDRQVILAISDIESNYKTFRDFLIANKVINTKLKWTFGKGHLVLVGDFVDRGFSTTQVLWFIYKLEQEAKKAGGIVHFIIGNHELYNMQGKYKSASYKYYAVASILGKQQHNLYDKKSLIGEWMASKNTLELINDHLFVHGGIHPAFAKYDITIEEINEIARANYYQAYFPKPQKSVEEFILSNKKGLCWYRGYFRDNLSEETIKAGIKKFDAKAVVVGHTIQRRIRKMYNGKVFAIDVKHPNDYNKSLPHKQSEGLLISEGRYFRVLANGEQLEL